MFPALYPIIDISPKLSTQRAVSLAESLARAGVQLIQIRAKSVSARDYLAAAREILAAISPFGANLIVNDRPDVAAIAGAIGVHVGQEDLSVEAARQVCPRPRWVGVSSHNLEQLKIADRTTADYIAVGPIFATRTKANPDPVVGLDFVHQARTLTRKPLVAIGGITVESAADVFSSGADCVAVISDLCEAPDPAARAAQYLKIAARMLAARL